MPNAIVLRNKNTLQKSELSGYAKKVNSLPNFIQYNQTHFSIVSEEGVYLVPANKIKSVAECEKGTMINCSNNKSIYSRHPIDYWQKSLAIFDRFVEKKIFVSTKIARLSQV